MLEDGIVPNCRGSIVSNFSYFGQYWSESNGSEVFIHVSVLE